MTSTTRKKKFNKKGFRLFLMASPFLALIFLFNYLPLYGWIYAFYDYRPGLSLDMCEFVGLEYFKKIFWTGYGVRDTWRVLKNTLGIKLLSTSLSFMPMIFAIFLSEMGSAKYKKVVQTLTTLPHFISWVLVYAVAFSMFSVSDGLINKILINLGVIDEGINFLISKKHVWLQMTAWEQWKAIGWGAITYLATITSIDQGLYEAATVDGAGRWQRIRYITIPQLLPTFFVLLTLSIGSFISTGMEQFFVFETPMNKNVIETLDLYIYNQGMALGKYSFSTAFGMLKSVVSILLLTLANWLSKIVRGSSIM